MRRLLMLSGLTALALGASLALPASADPPHHDQDDGNYGGRSYDRGSYDRGSYDRGYYGDRYSGGGYSGRGYDRGYSGSDHARHDAYDHGYGPYGDGSHGGYRNGYDGYGNGGYYGRDAYRHDGHRAERSKWTHGGRHVIDRRHGHHR